MAATFPSLPRLSTKPSSSLRLSPPRNRYKLRKIQSSHLLLPLPLPPLLPPLPPLNPPLPPLPHLPPLPRNPPCPSRRCHRCRLRSHPCRACRPRSLRPRREPRCRSQCPSRPLPRAHPHHRASPVRRVMGPGLGCAACPWARRQRHLAAPQGTLRRRQRSRRFPPSRPRRRSRLPQRSPRAFLSQRLLPQRSSRRHPPPRTAKMQVAAMLLARHHRSRSPCPTW
jgi:hypothetical protein